jgi:hypothetical protein
MKLIVLAILLALAMSLAEASPLQGGDGNMTVKLFGATRAPLADENVSGEILKVDVGLKGAENATFKLVDAKNNVYEPFLYKPLSSGKQLVYFLVPEDDLFKLITVTPTSGKPININWWATPKSSNKNLLIRYYGITDWFINPDEQGIVLQLRVTNNGTKDLYVAPQNFTLLDQWGWAYSPTLGFDPMVVAPENATPTRVKLGFTVLSLLSKPAALAYDYMTPNQVIIDLENDQGQLSDVAVYGANATKSATSALPTPTAAPTTAPLVAEKLNQTETNQTQANNTTSTKLTSLKDRIAASKARLGGPGGETPSDGQKSAIGSKLNSSLGSVRERLAATRANLDKSTQNNSQNNTQNNSV